jgi:alpha-tubulin suppressor-like RCC1 family protein
MNSTKKLFLVLMLTVLAPVAHADAEAPIITLNGDAVITNECHAAFTDPGATATGASLAIAGGGEHSLALKSDGTIAVWGEYYNGSTYVPMFVPVGLSNVVAIAGGGSHNLALERDGTVAAWGQNSYGQANVPVELINIVAIAAGGFHSLALYSNGTVATWGRDD